MGFRVRLADGQLPGGERGLALPQDRYIVCVIICMNTYAYITHVYIDMCMYIQVANAAPAYFRIAVSFV